MYWNPCDGLPPIVIERPSLFFGVQILSGLGALLLLLAIEMSR